MNQRDRTYYIDWIRIGVVLLLVLFHAAITFTIRGDMPIKYPQHAPILNILMWFLSLWNMPILFLISGMSSYYSLQKRTDKEYMRERRNKLLIPFLAGFLLICPIISYFRALFIGSFSDNFLQFYPHFFDKAYPQGNLSWWHFWFLIYLYVFTLILRPVFVRMNKKNLQARIIKISAHFEKGLWIYLLPIPFMATEMILRPLFPGVQNLIWDWANFTFYFLLVFFGFVFAMNEKILDNIHRIRVFSLTIGVILFAAVVVWSMTGGGGFSYRIYHAYKTLMIFAWMFTILGYAKAFLNMKNRLYPYLNNATFPFYAFHYLPITILAFFIAKESMNVWFKYLIIVFGTYLATFALYEIIKRIPFLRFLFGIKLAGVKYKV
jgi:Acyltransferase family.